MLNKLLTIVDGRFKIGINWYYNKKPTNTLAYLHDPAYAQLDPDLLLKLKSITESRNLSRVCKDSVLPCSDFIHYLDEIPYQCTPSQRKTNRESWFQQSIDKGLKDANIVFLDPDNGIPYPAGPDYDDIGKPMVGKERIDSIKYAYADEINDYFCNRKSVIVYSHRDREPEAKYKRKFSMLKEFVKLPGSMSVLRFKKVQPRDYLLIPRKEHVKLFQDLYDILTSPPFNFLFNGYDVN